ncbi:MAG: hypothetical protein M1813_003166 [Trichoglossum hirsutum]|nr:MAG: hypothetical protein M1813_003166 [Trichoglossum hirsutum]
MGSNGTNVLGSSPTPTSPLSPTDEKPLFQQQQSPTPPQIPTIQQPPAGETQATKKPPCGPYCQRLCSPENLISILWLGPALTLLILNFQNHIVGASIGCRGSGCHINSASPNQVEQAQRLDKKDHDALGALQFVAKGLEVWFMFVAGCLVYSLMTRLSRKDGLPLNLLTVYAEFLGLLYLWDLAKALWKNIKPYRGLNGNTMAATTVPATTPANGNGNGDGWKHYRLYMFVGFAAILCVVANLMGVATAVLVLPTQQWIDINSRELFVFDQMKSAQPPSDPSVANGCNSGLLAAGNYSCTSNLYSANLDEMTAAAVSTERQTKGRNGTLLPPVSQEDDLTFSVNVSATATTIWVPNRQVLRDFSVDWSKYGAAATSNDLGPDYPDSARFNQSLQARLQRNGPIVGLTSSCIIGNVSVFTVDNDREVRCYPGKENIKCIRWGSGWPDNTQAASGEFVVANAEDSDLNMSVAIYATNRASYLKLDEPCLHMGLCNWDAIFSVPSLSPALSAPKNISGSQQSFEYNLTGANSLVMCSTAQYLGFATYVLNPAPNILNLVELDVLTKEDNDAEGILVHPDWNLAAWSVDRNGVVPSTKGSALPFVQAIGRWLGNEDPLRFNFIHQYAVMQALSMITYTTTNASRTNPPPQQQSNGQQPPTLKSWATVRLWKYGLDSRTSRLGAFVMLFGCVCVVLSLFLYEEGARSLTQLMIEALLHPHLGAVDIETGYPVVAKHLPKEVQRPVGPKHARRSSTFSFQHRATGAT